MRVGKKKSKSFWGKCEREGSFQSLPSPCGFLAPEDGGLDSNKTKHAKLTGINTMLVPKTGLAFLAFTGMCVCVRMTVVEEGELCRGGSERKEESRIKMSDSQKDFRCSQWATARGKWKEQPTYDWTVHVYIIRCSEPCVFSWICVCVCVCASHRMCTALPKSPKLQEKVKICVWENVSFYTSKNRISIFSLVFLCPDTNQFGFFPNCAAGSKYSNGRDCSAWKIKSTMLENTWPLVPLYRGD